MAKKKEPFNPFYVLLVLLGIAFSITACAYGVMAWRDLRGAVGAEAEDSALLGFLRDHGTMLLGVELVLLAVATFGAMGTDRFWQRRAEAQSKSATAETEQHREQAGR